MKKTIKPLQAEAQVFLDFDGVCTPTRSIAPDTAWNCAHQGR